MNQIAQGAGKTVRVLVWALAFSAYPCATSQANPIGENESAPAFLEETTAPAYQVVEQVSDSVYSVVRSHLISNLLPERLTRHMSDTPRSDSAATFTAQFKKKESRFIRHMTATYPVQNRGGLRSAAELSAWQAHLGQDQLGVLTESLGDSLVERYKMEAFGRFSGSYAADSENWDPAFLTVAGVIGGAILYLDGLHADAQVKGVRVALDVRPGAKLRRAFESGADSRLAGVELSYRDSRFALQADFGLQARRLAAQRVGLRYALKY